MTIYVLHGAFLAALLFFTSGALAQTATGSISGIVQDEGNAVIPGASITITNVDTGISRTMAADSAGRYHMPDLIPGPYEVQAQAEALQRRFEEESN